MIHPNTELRLVNEQIGYGVFATSHIPEGTIVYVKDSLDLTISPADYLMHSEEMQKIIEKYSYVDQNGNRILSWDFAKYVNHCCNCNSISTGYGFEIAIRDICKGDQITDEYAVFNLDQPMTLACGELSCRKVILPADFEKYYEEWDRKISRSIRRLFKVEQPLMPFIDQSTRTSLDELNLKPETYKSVYSLKHFYPHSKLD